ncbi:helix-turn-helix domain-containing protein [Billgrantia azerbaijanica]|nr:helix-turn-helix domain-containing protein [Halomonas azerbaijanica]
MSDTHYTDAADVTPQASPGEQLKREREAQGLSRDDVATALNLRPAVVAGLEEDRFDEVPIAAYRRGYLRAYARLLGIEERPVLDAYTSRFGHEEPPQHTTPVQVTKPPSRLGAWLFKLASLLVIAGLIGLTLLWWQSRGGGEPLDLGDNSPITVDGLDGTPTLIEEPLAPDDETLPPLPEEGVDALGDEASQAVTEEAMPSEEVAPDEAATDAEPAETGEASATRATDETIAAAEEEPSPTEAEAPATETTASTEPAADTAAAEPEESAAPAADSRVLEFTFNEQSWTEVFDADNERIFVGLQEPGTSARVEGEPPFRLTVGNATGVELTWGGEAVNLGERAGANNVARFTLGE